MIQFQPQGRLGRLADTLMLPVMYLLQGTFHEVPQRTHRWNNYKVRVRTELAAISLLPRIRFDGDPAATERWLGFIPRFHMPIFGGWKKFVVLRPVDHDGEWHVGWMPSDDSAGISMVPVRGPVRVTIGGGPVSFFALTSKGVPLFLKQVGEGTIRNAGAFRNVPLL